MKTNNNKRGTIIKIIVCVALFVSLATLLVVPSRAVSGDNGSFNVLNLPFEFEFREYDGGFISNEDFVLMPYDEETYYSRQYVQGDYFVVVNTNNTIPYEQQLILWADSPNYPSKGYIDFLSDSYRVDMDAYSDFVTDFSSGITSATVTPPRIIFPAEDISNRIVTDDNPYDESLHYIPVYIDYQYFDYENVALVNDTYVMNVFYYTYFYEWSKSYDLGVIVSQFLTDLNSNGITGYVSFRFNFSDVLVDAGSAGNFSDDNPLLVTEGMVSTSSINDIDEQGYSNWIYNQFYRMGQEKVFNNDLAVFFGNTIGGIFNTPILGTITLGSLLLACIGVMLAILFLKFFAGG